MDTNEDTLQGKHSNQDAFRPLVNGARVRLDAASCVPERFPDNVCGLCLPACPLSLLESSGGAPRLVASAQERGEACIGCGQCAVVCPGGALQVDGFVLPAEIPVAEEILIDCWRVPAAESASGTVRVPCLGGLSTGWLLALFDAAGEVPIRLLDRDHCGDCPAGAGIKALLDAITETRLLLFECGVDAGRMPMMAWRPGETPLLPAIPERQAEAVMPRRSFFRSLIGEGARAVDAIQVPLPEAGSIQLRAPMQPLERLRQSAALSRIARRHGRDIPARTLPQLSLDPCDGHGICAAVCPTGALKREPAGDDGSLELRFMSLRCISCGQCTRVCPDRALRFTPEGGGAAVEVLGRWQSRECARCGVDFAGMAGVAGEVSIQSVCPVCRKTDQLSRGVAGMLRQASLQSVCSEVSQP